MNKRQVIHITTVHHPMDTRIFSRECLSLSEKFDVCLFAPGPKMINQNVLHIRLPEFKNLFCRLLFTHTVLLWKLFFRNKAAVYHIHDPELLPLALFLNKFNYKVIYDVHEWVEQDIQNKTLPFKNHLLKIYLWLEKKASKKIHFIFAEESYVKTYQNPPKNFTVILNFPDYKSLLQYQKETRQSKKLFYIGNLTGNRGLKQMIEILNVLKDKNEIFELICVGRTDRSLQKYLESVEGFSKIKDQIRFIDYMVITRAMELSVDCLAGFALYDDLPNHRESYSTKMFEYMAVGLPVISSHFPVYRDILEKYSCGFCMNPDEIEKISDKILFLYNNPEIAKKIALNGMEAVRNHFSWETEKQKLFETYNQLLN